MDMNGELGGPRGKSNSLSSYQSSQKKSTKYALEPVLKMGADGKIDKSEFGASSDLSGFTD